VVLAAVPAPRRDLRLVTPPALRPTLPLLLRQALLQALGQVLLSEQGSSHLHNVHQERAKQHDTLMHPNPEEEGKGGNAENGFKSG
jgi:hypothetical protein